MRILSLNINWDLDKMGPWARRRDRIARTLRALEPDLVLLQAVRMNALSGKSQVDEITELATAYQHTFFCGAARNEYGSEGTAVLSRVPVLETDVCQLSLSPGNAEDAHLRAVQYVRVDCGGQSLSLFNCHFSWVREQNRRNIQEVLAFAAAHPNGATLLAGDFNATPDQLLLTDLGSEAWHDVWDELRSHDAGCTFQAPNPSMRIDYFWADEIAGRRVRQIRLVGGCAGAQPGVMSDHFGLILEID